MYLSNCYIIVNRVRNHLFVYDIYVKRNKIFVDNCDC